MNSIARLYELKGRVDAVINYLESTEKYSISSALIIKMLRPETDQAEIAEEEEEGGEE